MFDKGQEFLIRKGLLSQHLTLREAVERAPKTSGGEAVGTVMGAVTGVVGGLFGLLTDPDPHLLYPGRGRQPQGQPASALPAQRPRRARPRRAATSRSKSAHGLAASCSLARSSAARPQSALWLLGVPFFYVLALISGVGELIPVVGPIFAADSRCARRVVSLA